jgi:chromosome segregation ATPase
MISILTSKLGIAAIGIMVIGILFGLYRYEAKKRIQAEYQITLVNIALDKTTKDFTASQQAIDRFIQARENLIVKQAEESRAFRKKIDTLLAQTADQRKTLAEYETDLDRMTTLLNTTTDPKLIETLKAQIAAKEKTIHDQREFIKSLDCLPTGIPDVIIDELCLATSGGDPNPAP